jgi:hypothetical protein
MLVISLAAEVLQVCYCRAMHALTADGVARAVAGALKRLVGCVVAHTAACAANRKEGWDQQMSRWVANSARSVLAWFKVCMTWILHRPLDASNACMIQILFSHALISKHPAT